MYNPFAENSVSSRKRHWFARFTAISLVVNGFANHCVAEVEPLAAKYWVPANQDHLVPTEELLWPDGTPDALEIKQKTQQRSKDHLNRWITGVREPTICIYQPSNDSSTRSAMIICPGGGYSGLAYDKEGHDTARWINSLGITAIVLKYRLREYGQPAPGNDAQRALALLRSRARELKVDPQRIGIMGYSAGGHVASTAGTQFREIEIHGKKVSTRPDFMVLIYPVISMDRSITHMGSRKGLLGESPSPELIKSYSNDKQVTENTPPTFLVHAADDRAVPIENSLRFMRALQDAKVPVELAIYERGGHGFGLVADSLPVAEWPLRCERWLRRQGILDFSEE